MIDSLIPYLEQAAEFGTTWGPLIVIFFMTIESSFIPFPSEMVMPPAGFLAARGEFFPAESGWIALVVAVLCGVFGSILGAYINYCLALWLGRPFLHRWGKYFFLPQDKLNRAEEVFREYGDVTTFVCRLLPVIRQLISLPAGAAKMKFGRFTFFTTAGAGLWVLFLAVTGYIVGRQTLTEAGGKMDYRELVHRGTAMAQQNLPWIVLGCAAIVAVWVWVHRLVMNRPVRAKQAPLKNDEA